MQRDENRQSMRLMLSERLTHPLTRILTVLDGETEVDTGASQPKLSAALNKLFAAETRYQASSRLDQRFHGGSAASPKASQSPSNENAFSAVSWKNRTRKVIEDDDDDDKPVGLTLTKWKKSSATASPSKRAEPKIAAAKEPEPEPEPEPEAEPEAGPATTDDDGESPFVHGAIKKADAEAMLSADGGLEKPGKFLIRSKGGSANDYILSVVYKGAATHHAISRESEGSEFTLNKQPTGATNLSDLIEKYRTKRPKWPVPLKDGVPAAGKKTTGKKKSAAKSSGGTVKAKKSVPANSETSAPSKGGNDMSSFFHGPIKKADAEALLSKNDGLSQSGKFLLRSKGNSETEFILSVVYKGAATHHMLVREAPGKEFTLNKNPTGKTTLADVVEHYREKRPKWPVPLKEGVTASGDGGGGGKSPKKPASGGSSPSKPKSNGGGDSGKEFFHGPLKKADAESKLSADGGLEKAGKFLIRSKGQSKTDYILSVVYKGAPTHHSLVRESEGAEFKLNNQPTGKTKLGDVIEHYRTKRPKWPVPLTQGVAK